MQMAKPESFPGTQGSLQPKALACPCQFQGDRWTAQRSPGEHARNDGIVVEKHGMACTQGTELAGLDQETLGRLAVNEDAEVGLVHPGMHHPLDKHIAEVIGRVAAVGLVPPHVDVIVCCPKALRQDSLRVPRPLRLCTGRISSRKASMSS